MKVPIIFADDLPDCECCEDKWCPLHGMHYADCPCLGPHNAEDEGFKVVEIKGEFFGVKEEQL